MNLPQIKLSMSADLDLVSREVSTERILELVVHAPEETKQADRPPLNLALVLDRSGSMGGDKLSYVKQAALHVLDLLDERDKAALVVYDNRVDLLSSSLRITPENRENLKRLIHPVKAGGATNLSEGWLAGCTQVAEAAQSNSLNHTLLLTDGLANEGLTDPERLAQHALELSQRDVTTSTFGVGMDFNQHLLEAMADQGGGNYYFIETPRDIPGIFTREFQELANVAAQDVEIAVVLPAEMLAQVMGNWRVESDGNLIRIKLGNMYGGRQQQIYLKIQAPVSVNQTEIWIKAQVRGRTEAGELIESETRLAFRYAGRSEVEAAQRNPDILKSLAMVELAQTTKNALKMELDGEREKAYALMQKSIRANKPYIDPVQATEYQQMSERMLRGMDKKDQKQSHYRSYLDSKQRNEWREYRLLRPDSHLAIDADGQLILIDTGTPISVGRDAEWYFLGHRYQLSPDYKGITPDHLSSLVGTRVDVLLGMDILKNLYFRVDASRSIVTFNSEPFAMIGARLPLHDFKGIPVIRCSLGGVDTEMCVDTGKKLTYLKSELVNGYPQIGKGKDFYPGVGEFETPMYEIPITLAGKRLSLRCGVLPALLEKTVLLRGAHGILGTEIFDHYLVELAFPQSALYFERY